MRKYFFCIWKGKCLKKLGCMISGAKNITFTKKSLLIVIFPSHLLYIFSCLAIIILYFFALLWHLLFFLLKLSLFKRKNVKKSNSKKKCCLSYNILTVLLYCCLIQRKKGQRINWGSEMQRAKVLTLMYYSNVIRVMI